MDVRTVMASVAFTAALIAGIGLGWWHGPQQAPGQVAAAPMGVTAGIPPGAAQPVESTSDEARSSGSALPAVASPAAAQPTYDTYDGDVFAIGDSVLAGAATCLARRGIDVDAKQSRRVGDAVAVLERKAEILPSRVIVHLGTNGGATADDLDAIMAILGPERLVLWSTIQLPDDPTRYTYERATNGAIADLAQRYDNVRIFDWEAISLLQAEWLYAEGIHMAPEGCAGYASLVEPQVRAPSPYGNG